MRRSGNNCAGRLRELRRIERCLVWENGPGQELADNALALWMLGIAVTVLSLLGTEPVLLWMYRAGF